MGNKSNKVLYRLRIAVKLILHLSKLIAKPISSKNMFVTAKSIF